MDAFNQFLTGQFTVAGLTIENWMLVTTAIILIWIAALTLKRN
jgi:hypothetical protein